MTPLSVSDIRTLDNAAIASAWTPGTPRQGDEIMRVAATHLAAFVSRLAARFPSPPVIVAVRGRGNNGQDAQLAAEQLERQNFVVYDVPVPKDDTPTPPPPIENFPVPCIVLDAILGIGFSGTPRKCASDYIRFVNRLGARRNSLVIAVDIPSGLQADNGGFSSLQDVVRADFTLTMGAPKKAFLFSSARALCGSIALAPLPYPDDCPTTADASGTDIFTETDFERIFPPRRPYDSHKGSFGFVDLIVGSSDYPGAAILSSLGALRGGAGLCAAHVSASLASSLVASAPELIVRPYNAPHLDEAVLQSLLPQLKRGHILAIGSGLSLSAHPAVRSLFLGNLKDVLSSLRGIVVDADALNALAPLQAPLPPHCILTPHSGEAARLLGTDPEEINRNRTAALTELVQRSGCVVILKGAGTLVGAPNRRPTLIPAGNPGMAKGGSGDILCGLVAAFLAQGLLPYEAACAGAFSHAHAADLASIRHSHQSLLPTDLLAEL
ncbi:MAG: NAD(P)H-hydrate dehydratase [Kiritimatiellia bacterium]